MRVSIIHDLTAFQRDILYILAGLDEPKGVEIKDELDESYDGEIYSGRLYPVLDDLADTGLIEKGRVQHDKRINAYELTNKGEREIEAHREWENKTLFN